MNRCLIIPTLTSKSENIYMFNLEGKYEGNYMVKYSLKCTLPKMGII